MVRYLISAHGYMASGIKETLNVILGESEQVEIYDAYVDDSNVENELKKRIEAIPEEDYLVLLSDLAGGSVNQIMMRLMNRKNTFLITGISLPLILGLTSLPRDEITAEEIEELITQSREEMFLVKDPAAEDNTKKDTEEDFFLRTLLTEF